MPKSNRVLSTGVRRFGRCRVYANKRLNLIKKKGPAAPTKTNENKEVKKVVRKEPRWYNADDKKVPLPSRKNNHKPTRLRASITPGTILIVLAGRFRGRRVVFLKQLNSGLLLVTGPYSINGVPLRRINQAYTIATSIKVDVSKVEQVSKIKDRFFKKVVEKTKKKDASQAFFKPVTKVRGPMTLYRRKTQKALDAALNKAIEAVPQLNKYLKARFSLTKGQFPHLMKF